MKSRTNPKDAAPPLTETAPGPAPTGIRTSRVPCNNPFPSIESKTMRPQARETLAAIKSLTRLEAWIRCARAELASSPSDELLAEFIRINERLLAEERRKLLAA